MTNNQNRDVRPIFIYLAAGTLILVVIGALNLIGFPPGKVILGEDTYSMDDLRDNNNAKSCWVSVDNEVYDITLFLQTYDGMGDKCGKVLNEEEEVPEMVLDLWKEEYRIGRLK